MGELAKEVRRALEAVQDPRNRGGLARRWQPRYILLVPCNEIGPRGRPIGVFEYPESLEERGLRIPRGWCIVYTDNSSYAKRKYAISLERARSMSDEELEAILVSQTLEFCKRRMQFWGA